MCAVSNNLTKMEGSPGSEIPFSPIYLSYIGRLADPAQTGVLGATIRGPNVRDSTSMTALAKSMSRRPSTCMEVAPLVRLACMMLSLSERSYQLDPIILRFVRNVAPPKNDLMTITKKLNVIKEPLLITAMPLDTFTALANNSFFATPVPGFSHAGLDNEWVAVPVRSQLIGQSHLLAYISAFLSSELWSGTVNYKYETSAALDAAQRVRSFGTTIPACNSVHIPGPYKVAIILTDETADNVGDRISVAGRNIPIWRGRAAVEAVDFSNTWFDSFWNTANIENLRRDLSMAHTEVCNKLAVLNTCGVAAAMAAEMYGVLYMGLALDQKDSEVAPDYEQPADGAWTYDGGPLDKSGLVHSQKFTLDDANKYSARRRTTAYNFSAVSPYHQGPTGIAKTRYVVNDNRITVVWSSNDPLYAVPAYCLSSMTSIFRVGTYVGLINTHTTGTAFNGPDGFDHWHHMLSVALSFSTCVFLTNNDLSPREWAGFDDRYNRGHRATILSDLKEDLFQGLVVHHIVKDVAASWPEWDEDIIIEYYGIDPYDNVDWLTFSPVPYVQSVQWAEKMGMVYGAANHHSATFRWLGQEYNAIQLTQDAGIHRSRTSGTIDLYRYFPQLSCREADAGYKYVKHWFDQTSYYSSALVNKSTLCDRSYYESLTLCPQINTLGLSYTEPTVWYVIGSNYYSSDADFFDIRVSKIMWPDPPLLETLWNGAKNYILKPAASALTGLFAEGPIGALVSGVGHIAQQVATDLNASKETTQKITEVENAARGVLGLSKAGVKDTAPTVPKEAPAKEAEVKKEEEKTPPAQGHDASSVNN